MNNVQDIKDGTIEKKWKWNEKKAFFLICYEFHCLSFMHTYFGVLKL